MVDQVSAEKRVVPLEIVLPPKTTTNKSAVVRESTSTETLKMKNERIAMEKDRKEAQGKADVRRAHQLTVKKRISALYMKMRRKFSNRVVNDRGEGEGEKEKVWDGYGTKVWDGPEETLANQQPTTSGVIYGLPSSDDEEEEVKDEVNDETVNSKEVDFDTTEITEVVSASFVDVGEQSRVEGLRRTLLELKDEVQSTIERMAAGTKRENFLETLTDILTKADNHRGWIGKTF